MNNFDWARYDELDAKLEAGKQAAGRTYTDTADFTPAELAEWRALNAELDRQAQAWEAEQERQYRNGQLAAMLGESDFPDTVPTPWTDAAMGL